MSAAADNFKIDPANYLGLEYNSFRTKLYKLALTNTEKYFEIRENLIKKIELDAIGNLYDSFHNALTKGVANDGSPLFPIGSSSGGLFGGSSSVNISPGYPSQKVAELCLSASATLNELIENIISILMPSDYTQIMNKKLAEIGNAKTLGNLET